jgi:hypothetical protein
MTSAETPCWEIEKKSQIFTEDFHLPLYLPLWEGGKIKKQQKTCACLFPLRTLQTEWNPVRRTFLWQQKYILGIPEECPAHLILSLKGR